MNNNTTVSPAEYFAEVKSRKQVMTEAGLSKLYENCLTCWTNTSGPDR